MYLTRYGPTGGLGMARLKESNRGSFIAQLEFAFVPFVCRAILPQTTAVTTPFNRPMILHLWMPSKCLGKGLMAFLFVPRLSKARPSTNHGVSVRA